MTAVYIITNTLQDLLTGKAESDSISLGDEYYVSATAHDSNTLASIPIESMTYSISQGVQPPYLSFVENTTNVTLEGDLSGLFPPVLLEYREGLAPIANATSWDTLPEEGDITHFKPDRTPTKEFTLKVTATAQASTPYSVEFILKIDRDLEVDIEQLRRATE
jgi:hypothetical protein